jgi:hypothetical protein
MPSRIVAGRDDPLSRHLAATAAAPWPPRSLRFYIVGEILIAAGRYTSVRNLASQRAQIVRKVAELPDQLGIPEVAGRWIFSGLEIFHSSTGETFSTVSAKRGHYKFANGAAITRLTLRIGSTAQSPAQTRCLRYLCAKGIVVLLAAYIALARTLEGVEQLRRIIKINFRS